jgi:uncharacterized protein with HEPN domain
MQHDDESYLRHILDAARKAISFTDNRSKTDLDEDEMLMLSLTRLLEIIGEAANGVSESFREEHKDIPWKKMIGMRNRLIHGYFDIDPDIVWETVKTDLPPLVSKLEKII